VTFRVPTLGLGMMRSVAVLHRLDVAATRAYDPPGVPTTGYDPDFSEPVVYDASNVRTSARRELTAVRVPCQVETPRFEELQQAGAGIIANTSLILVVSRFDLERLSLLDPTTRAPLIRKSDRVSAIERYGVTGQSQQPLADDGLYVLEVRPASWGFGTEGHDLELVFLAERANAIS